MGENTFEVFQALEDRKDDLETIEDNGPIKAYDICPITGEESTNRRATWLGDGYYFWETDKEHAHWWGSTVKIRDYKSGYIVCKAVYDFIPEKCFDLFGNTKHRKVFREFYKKIKEQKLDDQETIAKEVFSFMHKKMKRFNNYKAIRVETASIDKHKNETYIMSIPFFNGSKETDRASNLEAISRVQICFFDLETFKVRNFTKIFPEEESVDMSKFVVV